MFVGYNLEIREQLDYTLLKSGEKLNKNMDTLVKGEIYKFINEKDGSINATNMQNEWFPEIKADIFISHSSKDKQTAIMLAGWLYNNFNLISFIDSCVWGYCDDLLQKIDDKYCYQKNSHTYNYRKRNYSTAHVHNMLSTALNTMLDKCECVFFVNTNNSIKEETDMFKITESPWIYNELSTIKTLRKNIPSYLDKTNTKKLRNDGTLFEATDEFPKFEYNIDCSELVKLGFDDLKEWKQNYSNDQIYPLLSLYKQTEVISSLLRGRKSVNR